MALGWLVGWRAEFDDPISDHIVAQVFGNIFGRQEEERLATCMKHLAACRQLPRTARNTKVSTQGYQFMNCSPTTVYIFNLSLLLHVKQGRPVLFPVCLGTLLPNLLNGNP